MYYTENTHKDYSAVGKCLDVAISHPAKINNETKAEGALSYSNRKFAKDKKTDLTLKEERAQYIRLYEHKLQGRSSFLSNLKIKNIHTQDQIDFNSNADYLIKNDYLYLVYNSIALQKKYESDESYVAVFITNTLASEFHPYKQTKNGSFTHNPKYIKGNTVNLSYKILISFFKSLYKDFKVDNHYEKIEFVKVIEAHKDFTPHLHAILYLKKEHLKQFEKYYKNKISQHSKLGRSKFEVIHDISRSASYILKYVQKDFSSSNDNFKVYYGWKLQHKIRAYTFTRQFIPREIFNKLSFHLSKKFALDEDSIDIFNTSNYYELVDKFTHIDLKTIDTDTGEIIESTKTASEDDMFIVKITKQRTKIENYYDHKITKIHQVLRQKNRLLLHSLLEDFQLLNPFNFYVQEHTTLNYLELETQTYLNYLEGFLEDIKNTTKYSYSIINYQIFKKHHQYARYDLVYDKEDWKVIQIKQTPCKCA